MARRGARNSHQPSGDQVGNAKRGLGCSGRIGINGTGWHVGNEDKNGGDDEGGADMEIPSLEIAELRKNPAEVGK